MKTLSLTNIAIAERLRNFFWRGVCSVASFGSNIEPPTIGDWQTEAEAMRSDWHAVGGDFYSVIQSLDKNGKAASQEIR